MAFYDRMADTATRLLTKFGKSVTFERVTSVFNPITGMDTSRTTATTDTVGVEIPINQSLIDGTRVQADDKFIVIDASFEPMMSDRLLVGPNPPVVSCAYPFNATQTDIDELVGAGSGITPLPIIDGGKGIEFTPQTGLGTATTTLQFNSPLSYSIDITSGKKAFELLFDFTSSGLDTNKAVASTETIFRLLDENGAATSFSVEQRYGETTLFVKRGVVTTSSSVNSSPIRLGVLIDADLGVFSVTSNGVPVSLSIGGDEIAAGMYTLLALSEETGSTDSLDPIDSDKIVTLHLYTDSADMTGLYPAGTTDICGNALAKDVSDSWAIVAIEPINPAGTPVAYRVQVRK